MDFVFFAREKFNLARRAFFHPVNGGRLSPGKKSEDAVGRRIIRCDVTSVCFLRYYINIRPCYSGSIQYV